MKTILLIIISLLSNAAWSQSKDKVKGTEFAVNEVRVKSIWVNDRNNGVVFVILDTPYQMTCDQKTESSNTIIIRSETPNSDMLHATMLEAHSHNIPIKQIGLIHVCGRDKAEVVYTQTQFSSNHPNFKEYIMLYSAGHYNSGEVNQHNSIKAVIVDSNLELQLGYSFSDRKEGHFEMHPIVDLERSVVQQFFSQCLTSIVKLPITLSEFITDFNNLKDFEGLKELHNKIAPKDNKMKYSQCFYLN